MKALPASGSPGSPPTAIAALLLSPFLSSGTLLANPAIWLAHATPQPEGVARSGQRPASTNQPLGATSLQLAVMVTLASLALTLLADGCDSGASDNTSAVAPAASLGSIW